MPRTKTKQEQSLRKRFRTLTTEMKAIEKQIQTGKRFCRARCKQRRDLGDFYVVPGSKDGLSHDCRFCRIESTTKRYHLRRNKV